MAAAEAPLTGVALAAAPEAAPAGWTVITVTVDGAAAKLGKGFGNKGGGYLCVSTAGAQAVPGSVVTDIQVLSDRSPQPPGYTRIPEFPEPRTGSSRKKCVYVKMLPAEVAATAVFDLTLSSKNRPLPLYLRIGYGAGGCVCPPPPSPNLTRLLGLFSREMGNFAVWCKKGPLLKPSPPPVPRPRTLSAGLKQLSLQSPDPQ
ncbi:MB12A protein, partial [Halcyon senegalensis]|nr:MB12A protein [Halcyon senegalensis]